MAERDMLACLREGLATPCQWRAPRLLRAGSLRLIKGDKPEQESLPGILSELQNSNRSRIAAAQRLEEAEAISESLWPEAEMLLIQQTRDRRGLPERPVQATKLDQLNSCMLELINAYHLALVDAYAARQNETEKALLRLSGLRVLEWTWREAELHRLRYQPLPGGSWQRANRVFFALKAADIPDKPLKAQAAPDFLMDPDGNCTRSRLYLNLQALGLFDVFSWAKTHQGFIARYCAALPDAVKLLPWPQDAADISSKTSGTQTQAREAEGLPRRFIHPDLAGPASARAPEHHAPAMVLDYSALAVAVHADQQVFFRREPGGTRSPERLLPLPASARRPGIRLLARDIDNGGSDHYPEQPPEHLPKHPQTQPETLYLSAGMTTIRALLHQVFSRFPHSHSPSSTPRARRQPLKQPSNLRTSGDAWQLVRQSARLWRIQNPSSQSSTALSVGSLVAFGGGKPGLARPRLGRVARILRSNQVLQIDLLELASFAVPVSVKPIQETLLNSHSSSPVADRQVPGDGNTDKEPLPLSGASDSESSRENTTRALLVYDEDFGWGLMTPPQQLIREGDPIAIRTNRMAIESKLRSVRDATQDFLLFQINPHDPQLGVPSYPRAHKVRRRSANSPRPPMASAADSPRPIDSEPRPPRF